MPLEPMKDDGSIKSWNDLFIYAAKHRDRISVPNENASIYEIFKETDAAQNADIFLRLFDNIKQHTDIANHYLPATTTQFFSTKFAPAMLELLEKLDATDFVKTGEGKDAKQSMPDKIKEAELWATIDKMKDQFLKELQESGFFDQLGPEAIKDKKFIDHLIGAMLFKTISIAVESRQKGLISEIDALSKAQQNLTQEITSIETENSEILKMQYNASREKTLRDSLTKTSDALEDLQNREMLLKEEIKKTSILKQSAKKELTKQLAEVQGKIQALSLSMKSVKDTLSQIDKDKDKLASATVNPKEIDSKLFSLKTRKAQITAELAEKRKIADPIVAKLGKIAEAAKKMIVYQGFRKGEHSKGYSLQQPVKNSTANIGEKLNPKNPAAPFQKAKAVKSVKSQPITMGQKTPPTIQAVSPAKKIDQEKPKWESATPNRPRRG